MIPRRRRPMKKGRKRIKLHNEAKIPEGGSILSDLSNKKKHYKLTNTLLFKLEKMV